MPYCSFVWTASGRFTCGWPRERSGSPIRRDRSSAPYACRRKSKTFSRLNFQVFKCFTKCTRYSTWFYTFVVIIVCWIILDLLLHFLPGLFLKKDNAHKSVMSTIQTHHVSKQVQLWSKNRNLRYTYIIIINIWETLSPISYF